MWHKTELTASRLLAAVTERLGVRRAAVLVLVLAGSASAAAQEYRGTQDQQMACTGDVFKLCWSEIPNVSKIVGCLQREKQHLSAGCRAVFAPNTRTASNHWPRHHQRLASSTDQPQPAQYEHRGEVAAPIEVASMRSPPVGTGASALATPSLKGPKAAARGLPAKDRSGRISRHHLAARLHAHCGGVEAIGRLHHVAKALRDKCSHRTVAGVRLRSRARI
jgi:hypothetical protein